MLDKGGESDPAGGVHVDMIFVIDILLVHHVGVDSLLGILSSQNIRVGLLKVFAVATEIFSRVFSKQEQLPLMGLGHCVTFETIFISALFLTHLTIPSQLL